MTTFAVNGDHFERNGKPYRVLSGAIHYFRVVPEYWQDRLLKLKACGFNTVETYIPWNFHEPRPGQFNFEGMADVVRFVTLAGEMGLNVIVRPSPYICAEWEFGGLPAWLLADADMQLRCMHKPFLDRVDAYYDVLLAKLKPLLCTNGGPIIAMQVENEYGSYGNDTAYMEYLRDGMVKRGVDVLLFTSDGPEDHMLQGGMTPGVLETVNFGSRAGQAFAKLAEYQQDKPVMCAEYWIGWFDHWGGPHHTRDGADVAQVFEEMLQAGASVNYYMFHGGTNFGFTSGANRYEQYTPTITSYDYDSLLSESGDITPKYEAVRDVISRYAPAQPAELPAPIRKSAFGTVKMAEQAPLFDSLAQLSEPVERTWPEPMEKLGQNYGFILYTTRVSGPRVDVPLNLQRLHDRALVFLDGQYQGTIERWDNQPVKLNIPAGGATLSILVENMGRVNYGPYLKDHKGITEGVRLGLQFIYHWTIHTLPMDDLSRLQFASVLESGGPAFYRGTLQVDQPADTFIDMDGWTKGVVWVNGFNLGRYWERGPQGTLYVPGPLLRKGGNEVVIFEQHGTRQAAVTLSDRARLG